MLQYNIINSKAVQPSLVGHWSTADSDTAAATSTDHPDSDGQTFIYQPMQLDGGVQQAQPTGISAPML
jgi:hypothetical protein